MLLWIQIRSFWNKIAVYCQPYCHCPNPAWTGVCSAPPSKICSFFFVYSCLTIQILAIHISESINKWLSLATALWNAYRQLLKMDLFPYAFSYDSSHLRGKTVIVAGERYFLPTVTPSRKAFEQWFHWHWTNTQSSSTTVNKSVPG